MSRRKQACPKSLPVRADDEEDSQTTADSVEMPGDAECAGSEDNSAEVHPLPPAVCEEAVTGQHASTTEKDVYRCEACGGRFTNLSQFMDHRNFDCLATEKAVALNLSFSPGLSDSQPTLSPAESATDLSCSPQNGEDSQSHTSSSWAKNKNYAYQCEFCEIAFQKLSHLKKHEQTHADQLPYSCDICQRLFRHSRSRDRHRKSHTTLTRGDHMKLLVTTEGAHSPQYICTYCQCSCESAIDLEAHMVVHGNNNDMKPKQTEAMETTSVAPSPVDDKQLSAAGEETPCMYCDKIFMSRVAMEFHVGQMHPDRCPLQCPLCQIQLSNATEMYEHMCWHSQLSYSETAQAKEKNGKKESGKRRDSAISRHSAQPMKRVKLECETCGKTGFESEENLRDHVTEVHRTKSNGWDISRERSSSRDPRSSSSEEINPFLWPDKMCCICHQQLESSSDVLQHIQKEHPAEFVQMSDHNIPNGHIDGGAGIGDSFPCELCPVNFMDSESLQMHLENVHKKMGISCRNKTAEAPPVICVHCSQSFPTILSLAQHMQTSHNFLAGNSTSPFNNSSNKGSKLVSPSAGYRMRSPPTVENVMLEGKSPKHSPMKETESPGLSNGFEVQYKCELCGCMCTDAAGLEAHTSKVHEKDVTNKAGFTCIQCHMTVGTEEEFENHVTSHYLALETEYGCTSCMKLFDKPDELQKHLIEIHAHHMYRCSLCREIFDSKVNIQVHFAIKHSNECKLYTCTQCSTTFRSEMEWQLHVKVQHLCITKPFRCLFCKEGFSNDDQLQTHVSTHKKQFVCRICKESFHVEYLLDKHMQEKHSNCSEEVLTSDPVNHSREATPPLAVDLSTSPRLTPSKTPSTLRAVLQGNSSTSERSTVIGQNGHMVDHLTSSPVPLTYKCEICGLIFSSEEGLRSHKTTNHKVASDVGDNIIQKNLLSTCLSPKVSQLLGSEKFGQVCVYCTQNFKTKTELEKHMKSHLSPTKQKCNICDQVFPSASFLAEHRLSHCRVMRGDVCVVCKVVMKNEEHFYQHSQEHGVQGTSMSCIVCRQTLSSILELQLHGKAHFQVQPAHYTCCVCLTTFPGTDSLTNINNNSATSGKNCYVCRQCYRGTSPNKYACHTCSASFDSQMALETHFAVMHKKSFQCIKCQESFKTEYEIQAHVTSHMVQEGNAHHCRICNRAFDSPAKLQCHLIDHTFEGSEVKCYVCDVTFNNALEIQLHVLSHDISTRRYCCSQCNQTFHFSAEMQNHLYVSHGVKASDSSYQCPDCTKIFTNVITLNNHRKLHSTLKDATLKCTKCPLTFRSFTEVQQHFVSVHSPHDSPVKLEKPDKPAYSCSVCAEVLSSQMALNTHLKLHNTGTKYSCSKCSKAFQSYQNFETHMKGHDSGGPFLCTVCQKAFSRKESMRSHMKCHTGIKPYRCDKCTSTFSHRGQLKDHMTTHVNQTGCETCGQSFDTPKDLWRHQVIMHNMKTGHTCHICNSTYSDATDLEFHMKRVHGLEKISWSVKDKAGHRCVVCNSPYKNLKDLEFHVQQIHGFNTAGGSYQPTDVLETGAHDNPQPERNGVHKVTEDSDHDPSDPHLTESDQLTVVSGDSVETSLSESHEQDTPSLDTRTHNNSEETDTQSQRTRDKEEAIILLKLDSSGEGVCVNGEGGEV